LDGEFKQRVGDAIFGADHSLELRFESVKRLAKRDEVQTAAFSSDQGIERRRTKASGEKLSCAVRFTCDERGAPVSSLLSRLRATVIDE